MLGPERPNRLLNKILVSSYFFSYVSHGVLKILPRNCVCYYRSRIICMTMIKTKLTKVCNNTRIHCVRVSVEQNYLYYVM